MKQKFRDMHQQMQDQMNSQKDNTHAQPGQTGTSSKTQASKGDYIDFEEIN